MPGYEVIGNEDFLYNILINNRILGAGLDVFNNEPYKGPLTKLI
jgi:phosphoglycerate dehydrogenase-like enzyme